MSSALAALKLPPLPDAAVYPQRDERPDGWRDRLSGILTLPAALWFSAARRGGLRPVLAMTRGELTERRSESEAGLRQRLPAVRAALRQSGMGSKAVAKAFAIVVPIAERALAHELDDSHVLGAAALLGGCAAEVKAGNDISFAAMLAAATAALAGIPVHMVTPDDRLAALEAERMAPVFGALGLGLGLVTREVPVEERRAAYRSEVTIAAVRELARDHLRDRILLGKGAGSLRLKLERLSGKGSRSERLQLRGLRFAVVLRADSVLIDEARLPVILFETTDADVEQRRAEAAHHLIGPLEDGSDFEVLDDECRIALTDRGRNRLAEHGGRIGGVWNSRPRREQAAEQALAARYLFQRDRDYVVESGRVRIVSEAALQAMAKTIHGEGLQQLIELAEGCRATGREIPIARITMQRFFQRYQHLCGVSADLRGTARELWSVYRLPVVNLASRQRRALRTRIHANRTRKWEALLDNVKTLRRDGQSVLIVVQSAATAQELGELISSAGLEYEAITAAEGSLTRAIEEGRIAIAADPAGRNLDIEAMLGGEPPKGLQIILGELHSAPRLDRRIASLCGGGDNVEAFLSLDDDLLERSGEKPLRWLARLPGSMGRALGRLAFVRAQRTAVREQARVRRELVKTDRRLGEILAFSGGTE